MNWSRQKQITTMLFAGGIALLLILGVASIFVGLRQVADSRRLDELRNTYEISHGILQGLVDAETGVRGYIITADPGYLEPYYAGISHVAYLLRNAGDKNNALNLGRSPEGKSIIELIEEREAIMQHLIGVMHERGRAAAHTTLSEGAGKRAMDQVRTFFAELDEHVARETTTLSEAAQTNTKFLSVFFSGSMMLAVMLSIAQFTMFRREISRRGRSEIDLSLRHRQMALVSQLADSLHSSNSREESYGVIETFAHDILVGTAGALYVYNNSRDQLHRAATWGGAAEDINEHFGPDECWALRRGKIHTSSEASGHVQCQHVTMSPGVSFVCLPITARGQTSGLLCLEGRDGNIVSDEMIASARNFADQLSLALVNIELRERLQNMAIRDPLTELYNRRFMDEALSRELAIAQRKSSKLCIAMLDIDHFKRFNDTYGHPAGDEVLKQVGRYLITSLRRSDFVCRYGGEELMLVLPDCDLSEGREKAQGVCDGIRALVVTAGGSELPSVTVSIGVAAFPRNGATRIELVANADQALYQAKREGRDRVILATAEDGASGAEHRSAAD